MICTASSASSALKSIPSTAVCVMAAGGLCGPYQFSMMQAGGIERHADFLSDIFPSTKTSWSQLMDSALREAHHAYLTKSAAIDIREVPVSFDNRFRIEGVVVEQGVTIWFAPGSSGKGWLALLASLAVAAGVPFLGHETRRGPVLYLDYEDSEQESAARRDRLIRGMAATGGIGGSFFHWMPGRGLPLLDQIEAVRREIDRIGAELLVVDSALFALGGNPNDAEPVGRFMNALNTLGVAVLLIAHNTKVDDQEHPFGSIFWHTSARATWYAKRVDSEDTPDIQVALLPKKANRSRRQKPLGAEMRFEDPDGPVTIDIYDISENEELASVAAKGRSIADQIASMLQFGPSSVAELAKELKKGTNAIRATLSRDGRFEQVPGSPAKRPLWQVAGRNTGRNSIAEQTRLV